MEENITFNAGDIRIEGRLSKGKTDRGVVITHPHPLYGGDMENPVVAAIMHAYRQSGFTTLRFNFRGVGASRGRYADGIGEQQDVLAALLYLKDLGITHLDLAGYSFGAWVNAHVIHGEARLEGGEAGVDAGEAGIESMVMVSPPAAFIGFDSIEAIKCLKLIITGSRDDIAPPDLIHRLKPTWNPEARFEIIEGADHFYWGYMDRLQEILTANLV
jgi:alpha/beta superfamily hydrolase